MSCLSDIEITNEMTSKVIQVYFFTSTYEIVKIISLKTTDSLTDSLRLNVQFTFFFSS